MLYPQYFIDDLKNRADLVRIIQPYAQDLRKKGANWMACCPFHQEKTPSFSVNPAKGFYKCFGCGKGGTAFNFLMEMEGLSFPEAVKRVAEISGVMLPEPIDDAQYENNKKKKEEKKKIAHQIIELNKIALEFWEAELKSKNAKAKAAREYLEKRGISEETQSAFRIAFSPDSWDSLLHTLRENGADEKLIEQSGLVSINDEKGSHYDRFRGRIMFPVVDINGNPIAFGARAMGDEQPKYLNSPETPAYVKGQHLYGLFQSKDEIRKKKFAILVEGYLDLIALYQFGIRNTAASLGTAFTPEQSRLLNRFTKKVVINYDGDSAGIKAARRAIEHMLPQDFEIKVLVLPDGKDPDEFVRENGTDAYNDARGRALPFLDFVLDSAMKGRSLANAKQKAEAIEEVMPAIAAIKNNIQKRESFDQVLNFFRIEDAAIKRDLWNTVRPGNVAASAKVIRQKVQRATQIKMTVAEQLLLELLVYDSELLDIVLPTLEPSDYESLATAPIFAALFHLHAQNREISLESLLERVGDDDNARDFVPLLMMGEPKRAMDEAIDGVLHDAENCVFSLRSMAIDNRMSQILQERLHAEQTGDELRIHSLTIEQIELAKIKRRFQQKIVGM